MLKKVNEFEEEMARVIRVALLANW